MKTLVILIVSMAAIPPASLAESCWTEAAAAYGGWRPIMSAPRDGTVVEMLQTYGVAPRYGIFKWTPESKTWQDAEEPHRGITESVCVYWRPYKSTGKKYVDPTGGAQNTVAYECAYMHLPYDKKTGYCKKP